MVALLNMAERAGAACSSTCVIAFHRWSQHTACSQHAASQPASHSIHRKRSIRPSQSVSQSVSQSASQSVGLLRLLLRAACCVLSAACCVLRLRLLLLLLLLQLLLDR